MDRLLFAGLPIERLEEVTPLTIIDLYKDWKAFESERLDMMRIAIWAKEKEYKDSRKQWLR